MHVGHIGQLREHWFAGVILLALAGLTTFAASFAFGDRLSDALEFLGIALLLYGALIGASRMPESWVGAWFAKRLDAWVESHGAGFYGLVALARFVQLEAEDSLAALLGFDLYAFDWNDMLMHRLMGFSMDSLRNLISASVWPAQVFSEWGFLTASLILALLWGIHSLGSRVFPEAHPVAPSKADKPGSD
ncbi:MAG TPA: hypothetical protein PK216_13290 [Aquimonas sp.]|nr:hypothetical protein [Aquimonas sp.]